jgi:hypothetical protein
LSPLITVFKALQIYWTALEKKCNVGFNPKGGILELPLIGFYNERLENNNLYIKFIGFSAICNCCSCIGKFENSENQSWIKCK